MVNLLCTAIKFNLMTLDEVPPAYIDAVKKELNIQDVVEEQPDETVIETPVEQPVVETPEEPTPAVEPAEEPAVTE